MLGPESRGMSCEGSGEYKTTETQLSLASLMGSHSFYLFLLSVSYDSLHWTSFCSRVYIEYITDQEVQDKSLQKKVK